ncbi:MAG: hypothetical protein H0U52_00485 [Chloroflexi bacterium]|nr:hypothetical protein [Chloroflexota bacterium]
MTDERAIDEAVHVALDRTRDAQAEVEQELAEREVPDELAVETVVHRAEDLEELVHAARDSRRAP